MPASRPAFHYALLASIALHALLLFAFPDWMDTARRAVEFPPPIIARLLEPEPSPPPPAPAQSKVKPVAKPAPAMREREPIMPTAPGPAPSAEPLPAPPPPVAAVAPPAPAAPVPAPAAPNAEPNTAQTADQYRLQLIDAARRIKDRSRYPAQAWENHWEGDVVLGVAIRANGQHSVVVNRSSRYEVLDQQAVQILAQALRDVPPPPPLRGRDLVLREVTVQYRQRD